MKLFGLSPQRFCVILWLSFWYLLAIGGGVAYVFLGTQPLDNELVTTAASTLSIELRIALPMVLLLGALGANVSATREFISQEKVDETWHNPPIWYWFKPFDGMFIAVFIFLAFRSGVLALATSENDRVANPNFYFFVAALSGMFTDRFYRSLDKISRRTSQVSMVSSTSSRQDTRIQVTETQATKDMVENGQHRDSSN